MISKELEILNTLRTAYGELPTILDRHELPELAEVARTFGAALIQFGRCERAARRHERSLAVSGDKPDRAELKTIEDLNKKGQLALKYAISSFQAMKHPIVTESHKPPTQSVKAGLSEFSGTLMSLLSDVEMKPSDVTKLKSVVDKVINTALTKGNAGLLGDINADMAKLAELRKRPDRGAVDNIPFWKIAAIAAFLGLWVVGLARCLNQRQQCNDDTQAAIGAGMTIAWLVVYFC